MVIQLKHACNVQMVTKQYLKEGSMLDSMKKGGRRSKMELQINLTCQEILIKLKNKTTISGSCYV